MYYKIKKEALDKFAKALNKDKLKEILSRYIEATSGKYDVKIPFIEAYAAILVSAIILDRQSLFDDFVDDFLTEVEGVPYIPVDMDINKHIERIIKVSYLYQQYSEDVGCTDGLDTLYIKLICLVLLEKDDVNLRINDFIKDIYSIDI